MNYPRNKIFFALIFFISPALQAYDNAHFYRATNLFPEPRFERDWLSSLDVSIGGGSTECARACDSKTVPLLDVYGLHNMHEVGVNVPGKDLTNPIDLTLIQLSREPSRNCFATYSMNGDFSIAESYISFIQNIKKGFFAQFNMPIRRLKISNICFNDLSPTDDMCPNINNQTWQRFKCLFNDMLERYCLSCQPMNETGIGDICLYGGWTRNYQETTTLDYIDLTIKAGVLIPSGKTRDEDKLFSLPLGYNGHLGVPISADLSFGMYEWLTLGGHVDAIFFMSKNRDIRMKTALRQSGLIKLAKGEAKVGKGTVWTGGTYLKADHFIANFSLTFAYSFASSNADTLSPCNTVIFDPTIVNSDQFYQGWKMHTLHLLVDYDFNREGRMFGPRIGIFYNAQISGERIFKTNMVGGIFGLDIVYDF